MTQPTESPQVPSNCLVVECQQSYRVEFEAEAVKRDKEYEVGLSLFDGEELCSSSSVRVKSLDQFTLRGVAVGYAEGWDQG